MQDVHGRRKPAVSSEAAEAIQKIIIDRNLSKWWVAVRLRQRVTKGAGSRAKALLMAYKLLDMAQDRWRKINGAELLPLVRAGVTFVDGERQEGAANRKSRKEEAA